MNLSIIIVNYNSADLTCNCLNAIFSGQGPDALEVIVVDNFSQDDSEIKIKRSFPQVRWLQMGYNSGFSRANNAGIREARGKLVLLLNSDTLNENNTIEQCAERFVNSNNVACGIQLLNPDRSPQISGSYFITGGVNQLLMLPFVGKLIRRLALTVGVKRTNVPEATGIVEVDWINGAFLMVKKEAIEKAGLLDEDFFLYFEEIEWCSRLREIGKMCIYGDLRIIHLMGATTDKVFETTTRGYDSLFDQKGLQIMVSALLRIRKQYGVGWLLFHLLCYLLTVPIFFVYTIFSLPFKKNENPLRQFGGFTINCLKLVLMSSKMIRNKPYFYKML